VVETHWTEVYEKFPFSGHLFPKPQTLRGSNRHLTQSRLQVKGSTAEKYCLLRVVVQRLGSFRGLVNFLVRRNLRLRSYTVYGTSNLPNFRILAYFPPYKTPKKYLPVTSLQPMGYIAEWFRFFRVIVEGPKVFRQRSFSATSGRGAGDPLTCPNFRLWPLAISIQNAIYYTRRFWNKDVWKHAILRSDVLFHQISSPLVPKRHFGDLSMQNIESSL